MPRPPRIDLPGLPQHVVVRGHNRADIFFDELGRRLFLKYLKLALAKGGCELHAFVLMSNHVHFVITGRQRSAVSDLMHSVQRRYSRFVNRRLDRRGTLFEGRFYSSTVQTETYLLACMRYIELNPVRAGIVQFPWLYPWSSYRDNAGGRPGGLLTPHSEYLALATRPERRAVAYRRLFDQALEAPYLDAFRRGGRLGEAVGSAQFKADLQRDLGRHVAADRRGRPRTPAPEKSNLVLII